MNRLTLRVVKTHNFFRISQHMISFVNFEKIIQSALIIFKSNVLGVVNFDYFFKKIDDYFLNTHQHILEIIVF